MYTFKLVYYYSLREYYFFIIILGIYIYLQLFGFYSTWITQAHVNR